MCRGIGIDVARVPSHWIFILMVTTATFPFWPHTVIFSAYLISWMASKSCIGTAIGTLWTMPMAVAIGDCGLKLIALFC